MLEQITETICKIIENYNKYCKREFGEAESWTSDGKINLLYTTIDNDHWEVQVNYILPKELIQVELWNDTQHYSYAEHEDIEIFAKELEIADFDGYYSYAHEIAEYRLHLNLEW